MRPVLAILSSRFPHPLTKGDRLRLYYQIKVLSVHFDIHLFCINEDQPAQNDIDAVSVYCKNMRVYLLSESQRKRNVLVHILSHTPLQVRYFYDKHIRDILHEDLNNINPDHIHVHLIRMVPYVKNLHLDVPMTLDYMDAMTLNDLADQYLNKGIKSLLKNRERKLIRNYEIASRSIFSDAFIISERDKNQFPENMQPSIGLLQNGVDTSYFEFESENQNRNTDIIFCGNLSYAPNIQAVEYMINNICPKMEEHTFFIAGADMTEELANKAKVISNLKFESDVPDIRDVYKSGKVMLIPIFSGSGQQNKALEAMACGVPCILTSFVNAALGAQPNVEMLIADDAESFILQAKSLLSHPEKRLKIGRAGRKFVEQNFNWKVNTKILVETIKAAING